MRLFTGSMAKSICCFILETTTIRRSRSPFDGPFAIARKNHPLRIGTSEEFGKGICLPAQSGFSDYFSWFQAFLFCAVCNYVPIGVLLLGYLLKWKHVYCAYQNAYHQDMTPDMVNWRKVRKSDAYGVPIIFIVLGIACVAAAVFGG